MTTASQTDGEPGRGRRLAAWFPFDLVVLVAAALAAAAVAGTDVGYSTPRAVAGFAFVLVLPGYALVAALFPGRPRGTLRKPSPPGGYSPGTGERLALAFGCSLAALPLLAVAHGLLDVPFGTVTVVGSVALTVVALSLVAAVRRLALPTEERYRSPSPFGLAARFRSWLGHGGAVDTALSVVLVAAVVLALGSVAYGLTAPSAGESYTSASVVAENETGGDYVASNYPTNYTAGESRSLTLGVENHHEEPREYAVVGELQRVEGAGTDSLEVTEREQVTAESRTVDPGETWYYDHEVEPTLTGEELRLTYYVYHGEAPEASSEADAAQTVHLWVRVE